MRQNKPGTLQDEGTNNSMILPQAAYNMSGQRKRTPNLVCQGKHPREDC